MSDELKKWQRPEYHAWSAMKARCSNPRTEQYRHYGARGIRVCARWASSFDAFLADMGERPSKKHSLDRINNDGHYEPANCRWATTLEQQRNRRGNFVLSFNGKRQALAAWAEEVGISKNSLSMRLRNGWSVEKALTTPFIPREKRPFIRHHG